MKELEILYYCNKKTDCLEPVVKEKGNIKKNSLELFYSVADSVQMEENMINNLKILSFGSYYVELLTKGYSYEEIYTLLTNAIRKNWEQPNFKNCIGELYNHRDALDMANNYVMNKNNSDINNFYDFVSTNYTCLYIQGGKARKKTTKYA